MSFDAKNVYLFAGTPQVRPRYAPGMPPERPMSETSYTFETDRRAAPHDPRLYRPLCEVPPLASCDAMKDAAMESYHEQGFLAVDAIFDSEDIAITLEAIGDLLDRKVPDHPNRNVYIEADAREHFDSLSPQQRRDAVRKLFHFCRPEPRLNKLSRHPRVLGIVERIIGGPVVMIQDMALLKPPRIGREKPWHQDHAYFPYPLDAPIVGVWIALDAATVANGCMHVLPGWHRHGPIVHFQRRDWQICDTDILDRPDARSVAVPLAVGGALFFSSLLPHGTPVNRSPHPRRALQFHYASAGAAQISGEAHRAIFGSEGKDVSC